jgi:uncharacterized protein YegL
MRRLPIYFLLDISDSMVGEPIRQLEDGMGTIIRELKRDPYALETVYVSIHCFAGRAKAILPLTDLITFYPPRIPVGSGTALGAALDHLRYTMRSEIRRTTPEQKGDWKPIVFLFTDGVPTDKYQEAIDRWRSDMGNKVTLVAVAFGQQVDLSVLHRLTDHVLLFDQTDASAYTAFFRWVTASIKASSLSIQSGVGDLQLAPREDSIHELMPGAASALPPGIDGTVATFLGRCQTNQKHYLLKYRAINPPQFRLEGAFPVAEDYFEWSGEGGGKTSHEVSSAHLDGSPSCPCCGNSYALCRCSCGNIFCHGNAKEATCPWCQRKSGFSQEGGGVFAINRLKG